MANLNRVMLIGRVTRDPEPITDKGAKFGFCVNNRKKNSQTGAWEDEPVFLECALWNRGEYKQAARFLETVTKGQQLYLEGSLKLDQWEDKNGGGKRSQIRITVDNFQYLEPKKQDSAQQQPPASTQQARQRQPPKQRLPDPSGSEYDNDPPLPDEDGIPF